MEFDLPPASQTKMVNKKDLLGIKAYYSPKKNRVGGRRDVSEINRVSEFDLIQQPELKLSSFVKIGLEEGGAREVTDQIDKMNLSERKK